MKRIIINLCFLCVLFLMSCNFATSTKKTYEIDVPLIYQETKEWCLPACTLMCTEFFADIVGWTDEYFSDVTNYEAQNILVIFFG